MLFNPEILKKSDYAKLAWERHLSDMDKSGFEFYFDEKEANRVIMFAELCRHWKGKKANERIKLEEWQKFYFAMLYGWREKSTKRKRFRTSYLEVARKNGKTTLLGIDSLYHFFIEKEPGSQIWSGATKEEQARIVVNDTGKIALATPELKGYIKTTNYNGTIKRVIYENSSSFMAALGQDSDTSDGFDPSKGIIDEYHAHKTDSVLNVIESGMGARREPTLNIITTAGFEKERPCYSVTRTNIIDILRNKKTDNNFFGLIFTLDENDDWNDCEVWIKANPCLNASVELSFLQSRYNKAVNQGGTTEVDFKTKNLNIWTDASKVWIKDEEWQKNSHGISKELLKGRKCFAGLDLASGIDLNAFILFFPDVNGKHCILPYFFMPEKKFKESDEFDYLSARNEGYLFVTPGSSTDVDFMTSKIIEIVNQYEFISGSFDRWNALNGTIQNLIKENMKLNPLGQGFQSQSVACKELEKLVNECKLEHFNNKMLRWMIGNVEIAKDPAGNIKLDKGKSSNKIDGIAGLVDSIAEWLLNYNNGSSFMDNPDNAMWI